MADKTIDAATLSDAQLSALKASGANTGEGHLAVNDAGDAMYYDGQQWQPARIAENGKGERLAFDGKSWRSIGTRLYSPNPDAPQSYNGNLGKPPVAAPPSSSFDVDGAKKAGYSDTEIADYLGPQSKFDVAGARKAGYSDGEIVKYLTASQPSSPSMADGIATKVNNAVNWLGTRFTNAAIDTGTAGRTVADLLGKGAEYVGDKLGAPETGKQVARNLHYTVPGGMLPTSEQARRFVYGSLAPEVDLPDMPVQLPGTDKVVHAGKIIDRGVEAIPAFLAGGEMSTLAAKAPSLTKALATTVPAVASGAASEAAGEVTKDTPYEPYARAGGALFGSLVGGKLTTPLPAKLTPNEARAVATADANNVPLSLSQRTGRLGKTETIVSRFPTASGPFEKLKEAQNRAADRAAIEQTGVKGFERTDPETMTKVWNQASGKFNDAVRNGGDVTLAPDFYNKATAAAGRYQATTPASGISPIVQRTVDDFFDPKLMKGGAYPQLTGEEYQSFRKNISDTLQDLKPGSGEHKALKGIRSALDDAMETSLPAEKAKAWQTARRNWANLKILTKAAASGTVDSRTEGSLAPNALNTALRQAQGPDMFARTTGGLNDIGHMKSYLADTFPNSGTPTVHAGHAIIGGGATLLGEHGMSVLSDPKLLAAAFGTLALPRALASGLTGKGLGKPLNRYLANQIMPSVYQKLYPGLYSNVPLSLAPVVPRLEDGRR